MAVDAAERSKLAYSGLWFALAELVFAYVGAEIGVLSGSERFWNKPSCRLHVR
jgi:hypothetical protein